ncbi:hypothetical protein N0V93_009659 [Gnomoniopsis smithogilvyi]|uniref:Major facilitator superfamily (MFS) profile domain-containing protein n=1 Tax=Gnomoniopsis smithogilvyi TaxID=1191159 RepID=A0A9W8YLG9_9PEZI|nr:hypothetical protein N0V93_009659 [Gnomoniopsis smithogilvyi]
MPQPTAAPSSSSPATPPRPVRTRPVRLTSTGSFHAGAPPPSFPSYGANSSRKRQTLGSMRRQSTHRYHTFPTQPPKTPSDTTDSGRNPYDGVDGRGRGYGHRHTGSSDSNSRHVTPLPVRQLGLLALLSICEQTALNSIGPYLPTMVASFPEIPDEEVGLYVGLLASSFALAQLTTNFLWGYFSDRIGRKPIMLLGTGLLMICFLFFGFCARYWQILVVHVAMGLLNGNAAVVPTVLGEVTDRSNQSKAFTWLPVMYSLGGITGPALGGLLVGEIASTKYPFLGPNIMSAAFLAVAVVVLAIWFEETLEDPDEMWRMPRIDCVERLRPRIDRSNSKRTFWNPLGLSFRHGPASRDDNDQGGYDGQRETGEEEALLHNTYLPDIESQDYTSDSDPAEDGKDHNTSRRSTLRKLLNWTTVSILITYLIFQIANISFNSLYPIFASASPPTGRDLGPGTIGVTMSVAGMVTILFQISLFEAVKRRLGNLGTFRVGLLGLALGMILMPLVGYQDGKGLFGWGDGRSWLLGELGVILILKNLSAVGGLSCVLLLITNSAPSHETLGTLNGLAQTLSAAGRSFGPFASGSLFTLSTRIHPKGEFLAWGLFGGVALIGWVWSLLVKGGNLESDDFTGDNASEHESDSDDPRLYEDTTVHEEHEDLEEPGPYEEPRAEAARN